MVLMTVGNSEGERRCDARCYNAKEPGCECVCGGKNHGAGLKQAKQNTAELAESWLDAIAQREGKTRQELDFQIFGERIAQGELF